jgi:hypothetical protein
MTSVFWVSESYAGREFIPNHKGAPRKDEGDFDVSSGISLQSSI